LCEDETHILDYQTLRATWSGKGKQIPTYGYHGSVSLFGWSTFKMDCYPKDLSFGFINV
jgi:hypothetical protein